MESNGMYLARKDISNRFVIFDDDMMKNFFCGIVDRQKAFSFIPSRDHCQRSSPSRISGTLRAGFEPA